MNGEKPYSRFKIHVWTLMEQEGRIVNKCTRGKIHSKTYPSTMPRALSEGAVSLYFRLPTS